MFDDDDDDECVRVKVVARDDGRASFFWKSFPIFERGRRRKKKYSRQKELVRAETARVDDRAKRETRRSLQNCAR
jgi:hypothetical protein